LWKIRTSFQGVPIDPSIHIIHTTPVTPANAISIQWKKNSTRSRYRKPQKYNEEFPAQNLNKTGTLFIPKEETNKRGNNVIQNTHAILSENCYDLLRKTMLCKEKSKENMALGNKGIRNKRRKLM